MTTYSSKSAARKGAKRKNLDLDTLTFVENAEGRWYWEEEVVETEEEMVAEVEEIFETNADLEDKMEAALDLNDKLRAKATSTKGLKIEKEREEQNGIKRPSAGGACREIWDLCDMFKVGNGRSPLPKEIKEMAESKGLNVNNAVIELYQWRKFNGITGRVKA